MAYINPLSLRYEFDFWGKNRAILDASLGEAAAQAAETEEARLLLTTAVARAYFRIRALSRQADIAANMTKLRRDTARPRANALQNRDRRRRRRGRSERRSEPPSSARRGSSPNSTSSKTCCRG